MTPSSLSLLLALVGVVSGEASPSSFPVVTLEVGNVDHCKGMCVGLWETEKDGEKTVGCSKSREKCYVEGCRLPSAGEKKCTVSEAKVVSGRVINPAPSAPTGSTRITRILEGMWGFNDMLDSGFYNFPPTMLGRYAQVPSVRTKAGYEMHMGCSAGQGGAGGYCDHFVMAYSCPPCEYADGGNIHVILLALGFRPFHCGTVMDFDVNIESHHHNLIVFHKQTLQGNRDIIKAPELMEFTFFAFSPATTYCGAYTKEQECLATGECSWNKGECQHHLCPKPYRPSGPWSSPNTCTVCPRDPSERRFVPDIKN